MSGVLLRRWVLLPVEALRAAMRSVASGDLDRQVPVQGPPEVAAIGSDAEAMRRRIVHELDSVRSATEALGQHSPVVVGLRRELEPTPLDPRPGLSVHGEVHAAHGVLAGDWWEAVPRADGTVCLVVADVSGHGAEACLVATRFKQRLRVLLRTDLDLLTGFSRAAEDLDDDVERFLSCVLVEVHPGSARLRWVNAGHPAALVVGRDGDEVTVRSLDPTGPLIGTSDEGWQIGETSLAEGELVLLMTDGVTEARAVGGDELGTAGVLHSLDPASLRDPAAAVARVIEAVRRHADDWRRDDVTCVAMRLDVPAARPGRPGPRDRAEV